MFKDRAITLLAIGQTFAWAGVFYTFPALLLRWEQDLGWSKTDLTGAITIAVLMSAIGSPLAGKLIDTGRGPYLMAGSAVLGGIGLLLLSEVDKLWQFYGALTIIGLSMAGCLYEPCFALVTRTRGKDAKQGIIFITLAAGFASTISFTAMHTLAQELGWRTSVAQVGLLMILFVAPVFWFGANGLEKSGKLNTGSATKTEKQNSFLRKPVFWFLAIGFAFSAVVHGATLHHLLSILDEKGLSDELTILAASFIGPMQVAGRLAMMSSEKFTSHHSLTIAAFFCMGVSIILLILTDASSVFLSAFVILFGGAYGTISVLRPLIAREVLGIQNFGAKSGTLALPYLVGSALAPYFGSIIWEYGGYNVMLGILVLLAVIGCLLYIIAHTVSDRKLSR